MRLSFTSKPISSPGRTDKFPPPLMRFLRSNIGSKSKGRTTRKSPLFLRRKKNITTSAIETQEPTSPKVTCIGQVRVRRSKKNNQNEPKKICAGNNSYSCCYCCFPKCSTIFRGLKICKPHFRKWVSFFNCRSVKVRTDSSKFDSNRFETEEVGAAMEEREHRCSVSIETTSIDTTTTTTTTTMTPPKNALLLTRCRSAPYRSSSLACQFWGSPLRNEEEGAEDRVLGIELKDSTSESTKDQGSDGDELNNNNNNNNNKELEVCAKVESQNSKNTSTILKEANIENTSCADIKKAKAKAMDEIVDCNDDEDEGGVDKKPLMLMRCKSEPARSDTQKFDPQSSAYWRHRRLGNTESSTPHTHAVDSK
ncbi:hypothetical protein BVRB_7g179800 [Beta vulgaris subsp. vulgaris]|uniref:Uncharacterized protein n=1 Tax=Beta vulgaris subsp. vulgaris TaxID=3555 RepID=A0A0J8BAK5_BETVV|nr:uncharacterized protein LOC104908928 [Beta vulgaris subsp. vulgaris]KMS96972.1 hypothetical protein BVRB_7g179800 [Beta vulgaris subsp. vulgaris]